MCVCVYFVFVKKGVLLYFKLGTKKRIINFMVFCFFDVGFVVVVVMVVVVSRRTLHLATGPGAALVILGAFLVETDTTTGAALGGRRLLVQDVLGQLQ